MFDYIDPLYGKLAISQAEIDLFQTPELARLRDISLSAVPTIMLPWGKIASRFEHSVGVAYLSKLVAEKTGFSKINQDLIFAGLLHDVGSPPFSHLTEIFLEEKLGKTHEQFAEEVLDSGKVWSIIQKYGGHPEVVFALINGKQPPFGPLIAGTIDLDNLDNTLRFGMSAGLIKRLYEPENLARAFSIINEELFLADTVKRDIDGWEFCREQVYAAVYSDTNLASGTMLVRAIELAFRAGDITEDFFFRTDHQALYLLENTCNPATSRLTNDARLWKHYHKAAEIITTSPSPTMRELCRDKSYWGKTADTIAAEINIPPEDVTVHIDKDKGYKQIDLPIKNTIGHKILAHKPRQPLRYMMQIYLHPRHKYRQPEVEKLLPQLIS